MKNQHTAAQRILSVLLMLVIILAAGITLSPEVLAEEENTSTATFSVWLRQNIILDQFCVAVYLDGKAVGFLDQGDAMTFQACLTDGIHELTFMHGGDGIDDTTLILGGIRDNWHVEIELQTHARSIEIREQRISDATGQKVDRSQCRDKDWLTAGCSLVEQGFIWFIEYGDIFSE